MPVYAHDENFNKVETMSKQDILETLENAGMISQHDIYTDNIIFNGESVPYQYNGTLPANLYNVLDMGVNNTTPIMNTAEIASTIQAANFKIIFYVNTEVIYVTNANEQYLYYYRFGCCGVGAMKVYPRIMQFEYKEVTNAIINQNDGTEYKIWNGTQAQYDEQFGDNPPANTQVTIIDEVEMVGNQHMNDIFVYNSGVQTPKVLNAANSDYALRASYADIFPEEGTIATRLNNLERKTSGLNYKRVYTNRIEETGIYTILLINDENDPICYTTVVIVIPELTSNNWYWSSAGYDVLNEIVYVRCVAGALEVFDTSTHAAETYRILNKYKMFNI